LKELTSDQAEVWDRLKNGIKQTSEVGWNSSVTGPPAAGAMIYNKDDSQIYVFTGTVWKLVSAFPDDPIVVS